MPFCRLHEIGDADDARLCFFSSVPKGMEAVDYRLRFGDEVSSAYPQDAKLHMERRYPGVRLASYIGNTKGMILVSPELREVIEKHCAGASFEYLPVTIMDHKKRPHSSDYTIVNPVGVFDCVDAKASEIAYTSNGKVARIHKLVLSGKKLAAAPQLFRVDLWPPMYILGPSLVDEIRAGGFTNVVLDELETTPE